MDKTWTKDGHKRTRTDTKGHKRMQVDAIQYNEQNQARANGQQHIIMIWQATISIDDQKPFKKASQIMEQVFLKD